MIYLQMFIAGLLNYISPCILPVMPILIGYLIGEGKSKRRNKIKKEEQEEQVQPAEEPTVIKVRPQDVIPQRKQVVDVTSAKEQTADSSQQTVKQTQKVGRNDECPCGSGKKYKKCCGKDV